MTRTAKTILGILLALAGAVVAVLSLYHGGLTWPVLAAVCVLLAVGGHLVSHSQMRAMMEGVLSIVRVWRGAP